MKKTAMAVLALALVCSASGQATLEKYHRVKTGMSYAQVRAILGSPSKELASMQLAGTSIVQYQWNGRDEYRAAVVQFVDGQVESMWHIGLD